ncbi:MAG: ribulose-phosphate 3-epimerase [Bdellovibrionales bacterium RIFOXYD1_FULL_55_31]|nr:MAG: ribulose-phosphate 3-epimerase [Bdellovibrionales bacterium RIFOXYD1_FULL_55_31]
MQSKKAPLLAPSLLSADFARLNDEVREVESAGADWLHLDIMDGHFVPNITAGPLLVQALRPLTKLPLDCHLMVSEPEKWIVPFAKAGADIITIHAEATKQLSRLLTEIRGHGIKAGVSINPATPLTAIEKNLDEVDLVLIMSVHPGFGGQKFIESSISKVTRLADVRKDRPFLIEIDGGIQPDKVEELVEAGVDVFVAGSSVFSQKNRAKAVAELKKWKH